MLHRVPGFLLALVLLALPSGEARGDDAGDARRAAIDAIYSVLILQRDAGQTDAARTLVQKAIEWEPDEPRHRFTLATIEAVAKRTDAALDALETAVDRGYANARELAAEPTLASLRSSERYAALAARVGRAGGAGATPPAPVVPKDEPLPEPVARQLGPEVPPAEAVLTENGPVGLYFQTKTNFGSGAVEKVAWYFEPGGRVHSYVTLGFSPEELAADGGTDGTLRIDGDAMEIAWEDGRVRRSRLEKQADGSFWWEMGLFTRIKPLERSAVVGTWEFQTTIGVSHHEDLKGAGNRRTRINRFEFDSAGTFFHRGVLFMTVDKNPDVASHRETETRGRWTTGRHSITLTGADGVSGRAIAFTLDDTDTPEPSDWLFHRGVFYRRIRD